MTYSPERPTPEQIQAEVEAEFDAYVAELTERNAKRRPRDSQPLAGWSKGWDK